MIIQGDALTTLKELDDESIDCVVTSPPYWGLRDYGHEGQLGLEPRFQDYIENLCLIFDEVKRLLKPTGSCFVNLGDTYGGSNGASFAPTKWKKLYENGEPLRDKLRQRKQVQPKSLLQIPARFAIAMTDCGWILRNEIIWHKPNAMPQSIKDRFSVDFEKVFFFTKSKQYYFEQQFEPLALSTAQDPRTIRGDFTLKRPDRNFTGYASRGSGMLRPNDAGRNKRTVWSVNTKGYSDAHFAVYPQALIRPMIAAGCPEDGVVLDPFLGSGTTALVARKMGRRYIGIELNAEYIKIAEKRLAQRVLL